MRGVCYLTHKINSYNSSFRLHPSLHCCIQSSRRGGQGSPRCRLRSSPRQQQRLHGPGRRRGGQEELKEDDDEGRRKFDEVIALLEQKIAVTAASLAEIEASKGKGKGMELRRREAKTRPLDLIFFHESHKCTRESWIYSLNFILVLSASPPP